MKNVVLPTLCFGKEEKQRREFCCNLFTITLSCHGPKWLSFHPLLVLQHLLGPRIFCGVYFPASICWLVKGASYYAFLRVYAYLPETFHYRLGIFQL